MLVVDLRSFMVLCSDVVFEGMNVIGFVNKCQIDILGPQDEIWYRKRARQRMERLLIKSYGGECAFNEMGSP